MTIIDSGLPDIPTPSQQEIDAWNEWSSSRPDIVRKMCESLPPWYYYDMPKTGQVAVVEAYSEDGTVRVLIVGDSVSIPSIVPIGVFGVDPNDLVRRQ